MEIVLLAHSPWPPLLEGEPQNEKSPPGILKEGSLVGVNDEYELLSKYTQEPKTEKSENQ